MTIRRGASPKRWTTVPNEALEDASLSWKARGLLAYLLSKPDDWKTTIRGLVRAGRDGYDSVESGLAELEEAGYLVRTKTRDRGGRWAWDSVLNDSPVSGGSTRGGSDALSGKTTHGPATRGEPTQLVTTEDQQTEKAPTPSTASPVRVAGEAIIKGWWDGRVQRGEPKPAQKWVAIRACVEKVLAAGWPPDEVRAALDRVPTVSIGTLEMALARGRGGRAGKPTPTEQTHDNLRAWIARQEDIA